MTGTDRKISKLIQKSLLHAAFVIAGLMLATTTAGATTQANGTALHWGKTKFITNCQQNLAPVSCMARGDNCSCNIGKHKYQYGPNGVFRSALPLTSFVPASFAAGVNPASNGRTIGRPKHTFATKTDNEPVSRPALRLLAQR